MTGSAMEELAVIRTLDFDMAEEQELPKHAEFADFLGTFHKACKTKKSKAQVVGGQHAKAVKAKDRHAAKLLKEPSPQQLASDSGITAADLLRNARKERAQSQRACSGTVLGGKIHVAQKFPKNETCSEPEMLLWMDKKGLTHQDAIDCSDGRGTFQTRPFN